MAVANFTGKDSQCYGWDITQFKTEEERIVFNQEVRFFRESHCCFHNDGLIFFVPEMCLFPWNYPDDSIMKQKFFFVHMPWEDGMLGMNWTPFYDKVKTDLDWHCFRVFSPGSPEKDRYIFYKYGMMPDEPLISDIANTSLFRSEPFLYDKVAVEQGGIVYRNRAVWENINRELAFNNNTKSFEEALSSCKIYI